MFVQNSMAMDKINVNINMNYFYLYIDEVKIKGSKHLNEISFVRLEQKYYCELDKNTKHPKYVIDQEQDKGMNYEV